MLAPRPAVSSPERVGAARLLMETTEMRLFQVEWIECLSLRGWLLCGALCLAAGCQRELMPTPNLYAFAHDDAFDHVPAANQNNRVDVLYVTDRVPTEPNKVGPRYGYGRSLSLAFGSAEVEIGKDMTWDDLARESCKGAGRASLPLSIKQVREIGRCPEIPYPVANVGPLPVDDPVIVAKFIEVQQQLHEEIAARIAGSDRKVAYVYVHGFNNTFEDALYTSAELWHYLGRQGVAICYTWPAGR